MRVLVLVALAACYDPPVDDCQFRCGDNNACPTGTTCDTGFCRSTATGSCMAVGSEAGVDADACPAAPNNCEKAFAIPGGCATICHENRTFSEAGDRCNSGPWRLAILDSLGKLDALPATSGDLWVGAQRVTTTWRWENQTTVSDPSWEGGIGPLTGDACALVGGATHRMNNKVQCDSDAEYICSEP